MTTTTSHIEQEISLQVTADVTTSRTLLDPDHTLFPTVTVVSNYSYVADEASGLQIIDITVVNEPSDFTGDDFDPNLDSTQWDQIDNGTVNQQFVGSDGNSLFFDGSGQRQATTTYLDLSGSDNILVFDFIYGDGRNGGENADLGDEVVLEYTTDGVTWSAINTYDTFNYSQFTTLVEVIPDSATQLRWRQINHFGVGYDHWGLDNIALVSPTDNNAPTVLNPIGDQTAIEGISFSLLLPSNTFADVDRWDTSLSYSISGLPNGLSFDSTTQTINGIATELGTFNVTITATDLVGATVDDTFDLTVNSPLPNAIEGTVWQDSNQNGIQDNDEAGLSQWTVYLDQNRNHQLDNGEIVALTDSNGHYRFDNLLPGTYYVEEVLPNNWQINYPYNTFNSANSTNSTSINNDSLNTASNTTQNLNFVLSGDYASHQVIIKFTSEITNDPSFLSQIQEELGVTSIEQLTETGIELWSLENMTAEEAITKYYDHTLIEYIEPNKEISVNSTDNERIIPDDPKFSSLWGFHNTGQSNGTVDADIDAPEAWKISTESPNIIIGVIDTGVDYTHPDLVNNIWINTGEIAGDGIDNDGNGYIDDIHGYDFVNNDGDPFDDHSHGTHVAGTIGAQGNNNLGVAGLNWNVQIMPLKFLNSSGSGTTADAIRALEYAIEMGVHITNNSWGGGSYSQPLYDAISAAGDAGQLFIAAAGNDGKDNDSDDHYPSNYDLDNIISVASTDRYDNRSSFSNYGATSVDLGAPGSGILSTIPGGRYGTKNGTSMATPMVTGVASLIWGINPDLTATEVKQIILDNVDPLTRLQGKTVSGGRLNAYNALQNTPLPSTYEIEVGSGDTITDIDFGNHFINEPPELVGQSFEIPENSANGTVIGTIVATDPDQDSLTYQITQNIDIDGDGNNAFGLDGNQIIVNDRDDLDYEINPSLPITLQVSDGQLTAQALVTINLSNVNENPTPSSPKLHNEILTNIGSEWQTINLPYSYDSMVVVATPNYDSSDLPAVVRIRQAEGSQLEIKVQNPSNTPLSGYTIHLLVLEEGVYTEEEHGFTLEAGRFNSTVTDGKTSGWNGQSISPQNNYQNPVVFGSVMTSNDQDWSSFWSRGDVFNNPADSNHIYLGKHIAADTDTTRQDETLGYVIFESGTGTIEGQKFSAQLGSDSIEGVDNNSDSQYNLSNLGFTPQVALASQSAMDGGDGGWAILAGDNPINSHRLKLQIDEDQIEDSERRHTTEQVSYLLFEEKTDTSNSAPIINAQDINDVPENTANNTVIGTIIATDPDGDALTYQITENIDIDGDGENAFRLEGNQIIVNDSDDLDYETNPSLPITLQVSDGRLTAQALVTINLSDVDENPTPSSPKLHTEVLSNIGSNWQTINLPYSYDSMVVVATPNYDSSDLPAVVRIRQAQGNQLEIKVQNPSDTPLSGYNIHLLVIEEGAYSQAQHGFTLEAGRFNSTVTDGQTSGWNGQSISPQNNYQNPVVLGSVMTNNDQDWSSFWSRGDVVTNPADGNNIYLGKHIGEDTDTTRQDETLGYVIFESGTGTIEGQKLSAQLGSDSILGVDNSESHYDLSHLDFTPQVALVSQSAMDGGNGGWAILAGDNPISPTNLHLQIDEDQIRDSERLHTDEQVSYLLFGEVTQTSLANSPALEPQFSEINQIMGTDEDDQLMGTSAADLFVLNPDHSGVDTINDFELGKDQIGLPNSLSYGSLEITSSGSSDTLISHETQALAILTMINPTDLMADDFLPVAI